jgi:LPXTG-site transpeptidase (sortase) family protein
MRNLQGKFTAARALRAVQWVCLSIGAVLCSLHAAALVGGEMGRRKDVAQFMRAKQSPDQSLWSQARARAFAMSQRAVTDEPIALLRIPSLSLVVPVYATSSELHLNRGVGLIERMSQPDAAGNVGIAGHRDGFFRVLKDISTGSIIEVQTRTRVRRYSVVSTAVVDAADRRLLADTVDSTVTLVTCHPFYYLGSAPRRFIVRGVYVSQ